MAERTWLARYDEEVRARAQSDAPGYAYAWDGRALRMSGPTAAAQDNGVLLTRFGEADDVDGAIARQVEHFRRLRHAFEWKLYDHDRPADLPARLARAGFVAGGPETLVVLELARPLDATPPAGIEVRALHGRAELEHVVDLNVAVYGERAHAAWLADSLAAEQDAAPDALVVYAAFAGDLAVSAGWARFPAASPSFGSLWGGATLPAWRGRGVYTALVARRAHDARARGRRWLAVDCSPHSLPILTRRGFRPLAVTTPWVWST